MNPNEELRNQEAFEGAPLTQKDEKLYELLFEQLENATELDIKPQFSDAVMKRLETRKRKESLYESLLFGFAIQAVHSSPNILQNSILGPAMILAGLIVIFQVVDKRYLKDERMNRKLKRG
mgnify:CR=1 FL=1